MTGPRRTPRGLILLALVPLLVAGCCNCVPPTPGPTLSAAQAAAAAASAAALPSMNAELVDGQDGVCY
jgi:acyl-CoA reductase-like NAD-dependent aldehyde dehydrogenase